MNYIKCNIIYVIINHFIKIERKKYINIILLIIIKISKNIFNYRYITYTSVRVS